MFKAIKEWWRKRQEARLEEPEHLIFAAASFDYKPLPNAVFSGELIDQGQFVNKQSVTVSPYRLDEANELDEIGEDFRYGGTD